MFELDGIFVRDRYESTCVATYGCIVVWVPFMYVLPWVMLPIFDLLFIYYKSGRFWRITLQRKYKYYRLRWFSRACSNLFGMLLIFFLLHSFLFGESFLSAAFIPLGTRWQWLISRFHILAFTTMQFAFLFRLNWICWYCRPFLFRYDLKCLLIEHWKLFFYQAI